MRFPISCANEVDVADVRRVGAVGMKTVEALVMEVPYELVFAVAVDAVDIGWAANGQRRWEWILWKCEK